MLPNMMSHVYQAVTIAKTAAALVIPLNQASAIATPKLADFDEKRYFGIYYDKQTRQLTEVVDVDAFILAQPKNHHDEVEVRYQHLWQTYFKHVTIAERKNLRHHIQQMPKRYWRYLTEKQAI